MLEEFLGDNSVARSKKCIATPAHSPGAKRIEVGDCSKDSAVA